MRHNVLVVSALLTGFSGGTAIGDEISGTISNIDQTTATFVVDGKTYTASPNNTVGTKLSDLQEGDTVKLEVPTQDAQSGTQPINTMVLEKVE